MHKTIALVAALAWTLVVFLSIWTQRGQLDRTIELLARNDAIANLKKDMAIRKWASSLGGVYVEEEHLSSAANLVEQERLWGSRLNTEIVKLVLLTPIHILRGIQETHEKEYGVKERLTSNQVRNRDNAPDEWETNALREILQPRENEACAGQTVPESVFDRIDCHCAARPAFPIPWTGATN